jgi:hypothetical protein
MSDPRPRSGSLHFVGLLLPDGESAREVVRQRRRMVQRRGASDEDVQAPARFRSLKTLIQNMWRIFLFSKPMNRVCQRWREHPHGTSFDSGPSSVSGLLGHVIAVIVPSRIPLHSLMCTNYPRA